MDKAKFKKELVDRLSKYDVENDVENISYDTFHNIFMELTDKHAPIKIKYFRANHAPFMSKILTQNISYRTKLRNKYLKNPSLCNKYAYKIQRNKCVKLLGREKRRYYDNLNPKLICDNKKFWKTVKPFFSETYSNKSNVVLVEKNEIINDDQTVVQTLNVFFTDIVMRMGMDNERCPSLNNDDCASVSAIREGYSNHPSILQIKESLEIDPNSFNLDIVTEGDIRSAINDIDLSKGGGIYDIPTRLLKLNNDISCKLLCTTFKNSLRSHIFPIKLEMADITPVHKKDESTNKENYRPVGIFPNVS